MIWFSNLLILRVPDEGYSRSALCALNLISTFYYRFFYYIGIRNSLVAVVSIYFRQKKYTWRKTLLWRWEYILNIWFCTLSFVLSVLLRYTDSDYPFGIFWPLCCLFFFDIRILITPLVSSNSSFNWPWVAVHTKHKQSGEENSCCVDAWPSLNDTFGN